MVNDNPFVPLPSPPVDPTQTPTEALLHGYDRDDEHARAIAYVAHLEKMTKGKKALLKKLVGNREAALNLQRKTVGLTRSAPPYSEGG